MASWVIEDAATALGLRPDPVALAELPPASRIEELRPLAARAGVTLEPFSAPPEALLRLLSPSVPVVVELRGGGLGALRRGTRGLARLVAGDAEEELDADGLRARLGETVLAAWPEVALAFDPEGDGHPDDHVSPWVRLARLARIERSDLGIVLVYAVMVGALSLVVPVAVQTLVNTVVFGAFLQPLFWLSLLMFAGLVAAAALQLAQIGVVEVLQRRVFVRLVAELGYRIPRVTQEAMDQQDTSVLLNRFFDVLIVQKALANLLLDGVGVVVAGVTGTLLLALYSPWFLFYALSLWVALGALLVVSGRRAPATSIEESYAKHAVAGWLEAVSANPALFRSVGASSWAARRADALARRYLRARDDHFRIWFRQVGGLLLLSAVASTSLLGLGGWLVIGGNLSIGQLLAAELVVTAVLASFAKLGKQLESLYDLLAALDKIGYLLELPLERRGGSALVGRGGAAAVEARDLSYGFQGSSLLFDGLTFEARPGERVALVGAAGSGRGTLLDLLLGTRSASGGSIRVDGVDLREADLDALRERVALVRGVEIVEGTVAENVRVGRAISDDEIRGALAMVGLRDAVAALPGGIHTALGPTGRPLSGSQARRLVLARALAGRPGLLLVDELVDGVPPNARGLVLDALFAPERAMTVLLVTRDPEVMKRCDRVLVFDRPRAGRPANVRTEGGDRWVA